MAGTCIKQVFALLSILVLTNKQEYLSYLSASLTPIMTTSFSSLPIIDLHPLSSSSSPTPSDLLSLSNALHNAFATTGFAYLIKAPLTFSHDRVFQLASDFFSLPEAEKMHLAKQTFVKPNKNTYRGYFPPQPGQQDNLKEGFEIGPAQSLPQLQQSKKRKFDLAEPNVWPPAPTFQSPRSHLEEFHSELQNLSSTLLSLLAVSLNKPADHFAHYLKHSLSTLRLLHYPPQASKPSSSPSPPTSTSKASPPTTTTTTPQDPPLCCTPHTDSGILTLLHQDPTGGLEVLNASGAWVPAPYIPGSIVVNIGDLLARVSGGEFVATMHRVVRSSSGSNGDGKGTGRFSVPFFFEPGEACVVERVGGEGQGGELVYGDWVRGKMETWVEYRDDGDDDDDDEGVVVGSECLGGGGVGTAIEAY
jgi:isopenicillin N synthase-like dioxygenase